MLQIKKRNDELVSFNPSKILNRIKKAAKGLKVNADEIFIKVITSVPTEGIITTNELDTLIANTAAPYTGTHYDYSMFAAHVAITLHQKNTEEDFYTLMASQVEQGVVNQKLLDIVDKYGAENIQKELKFERDVIFDFFAWKSLEQMYLLRNSNGIVVERPQHMYMRIALWITNTFEEAVEYYDLLSRQLISCATPTMINSGTMNANLASCVLMMNEGDSADGLLNTFSEVAKYSASGAGIGLCMSNIRSKKSRIKSSGGYAGGLLKYLKMINENLRFFNQQGKRPGVAAIYLEPWHKDIFDFLDIKKNTGSEEMRAKDLFTALWMPDNFMQAVKDNSEWYLFCPNDIKKAGLKPLYELYGEEYELEYKKAVDLNLGEKVSAQDIMKKIIESQIETGVPYIGFKDNVNRKTNHQNYGTIKQSNLCIEICEFSSNDTTSICFLASQVLKNYVEDKKFNFGLLSDTTKKQVNGLNNIIDINRYADKKGRKGALQQRAIAIGVQGLADLFYTLDYTFLSPEAKKMNKDIFETIYYSAIRASCDLVKSGKYQPYDGFQGSPMSNGIFQFDMWGVKQEELSGMYDWQSLKEDVMEYGVCNSLFVAQMPVASSASITGSYEMTEPMGSNLFNRRVIGGEFLIVNKYLILDLEKINLWNENIKDEIIMNNGSIQNVNFQKYLDPEDKNYAKKIKRVEHLMEKYRTVWEYKQKDLIDLAADRAIFVDQSQSMNIYMAEPTLSKLSSSMFYSWEKGLKTGSYYIRTKAISTGAKHLAIAAKEEKITEKVEEIILTVKPEDSPFNCEGCSA